MEIVNKILHLWVKVMSHRGEASMKHNRKVRDFCPIITPLDYTVFSELILMLYFEKLMVDFKIRAGTTS